MRTTVTLDDALLAQAQQLCDENERSALGERESARRLAALGGSQPDLEPISRRRSAA
ncbi:type II toxin-antitoxin system VapB family antitoxin [Synechococcus sp. CBW1107]|uniref:type II toxin-antitoxin system VapB family antitoxin n=1 Tax=Synechococcus sp. CBW1107 TaxID=2789857 RepID=UPI002AD2E0B0|nr:type II toxin-antitoxin system VapB family antitoxin [Synechococcus sp. CBW1107]CAK6697426.1 Antitoxin VapB32 [Synechococcus sp. CBW1107]